MCFVLELLFYLRSQIETLANPYYKDKLQFLGLAFTCNTNCATLDLMFSNSGWKKEAMSTQGRCKLEDPQFYLDSAGCEALHPSPVPQVPVPTNPLPYNSTAAWTLVFRILSPAPRASAGPFLRCSGGSQILRASGSSRESTAFAEACRWSRCIL